MSVDMTDELQDLLDIYERRAEHLQDKEETILPFLVSYMKEFCEVYDNRLDMEKKMQILKLKLHISQEDEGDDE